jgi:hypothetical protein
MLETLIITDLTQMPDGNQVCVTGINKNNTCIRPVCDTGFLKSYLYINKKLSIKPKAKIGFNLTPNNIKPPHIEDKAFDPNNLVTYGVCNDIEWEQTLKNTSYKKVQDIYNGLLQEDSWVKPGAQTRSIATLSMPNEISVQLTEAFGKLKYRLSFIDFSGTKYDCPVSDLAFRELSYKRIKKESQPHLTVAQDLTTLLKTTDRIYLRLGLARPFKISPETDPRCYLQVTGIYTFPDYLKGKTFADFK